MEIRSLVNEIESYLKSLLKESPEGSIEVRRKDVAELFNCAPSQVTYVLNTRFSERRGYLVESRRGGGGYIRIYSVFKVPEGDFSQPVEIKEKRDVATTALHALARRGVFTRREFQILSTALEVLKKSLPAKDGEEVMMGILRALAREGFF
ncbi:MAG: CtsR family transcriptional regulator [Thermacetogeniaceae bacterium]